MPIYYVTKNGLERLRRRIEKMEGKLADLRAEKAVAYHESGDTWHDNPGFNQLEQAERRKVEELGALRRTLAAAVLCDTEPRETRRVSIGSIARCYRAFESGQEEDEALLEVVGYGEADPTTGRISYDSPVGRALLGLEPGDSRRIETPKGTVEYEIGELYSSWEEAREED